MEYCGGGSLSDLMMKGRFTLKEDEIRYVLAEILMGIAYLHSEKKVHRVSCILCAFSLGYQIRKYSSYRAWSGQASRFWCFGTAGFYLCKT